MADVCVGDLYHRLKGDRLPGESSRGVLHWKEKDCEAVQFRCPCFGRLVYVTAPPHNIQFADDGVLASLGGSCGYHATSGRPQNWCHFTITDGAAEMHGDAQCPGRRIK